MALRIALPARRWQTAARKNTAARGSTAAGRLHPWRWAAAGMLIGLLLTCLIWAPARWLAGAVAWATQDKVQLSAAQGTVWNGSAWLVLSGGRQSRDATTLPSRLHWKLQPRWLGANMELHSSCCTTKPVQARLRWQPSGARLHVDDSTLQLPSSLLAGLGTPWYTLQLDGTLSASMQQVQFWFGQQRVDYAGTVNATLQQASTRLSTIRPIGSYRVHLRGGKPLGANETPAQATPAEFSLETLPGSSLQLTGSGQWVGGRLRFSGEAYAVPERAAALNNLLNIIGQRSGERSLITLG